ncbi:MAG: hypothetical protein UHO61_03895 [Acutalibacteraceae bacterium]|nr:hypothetical protein [Acutalibacteraceae bacterium]
MDETKNSKPKSGFFGIIITQSIVTLIILLSVLTVKYFFKSTYSSLKEWYNVNICAETDINEVLDDGI